MCSVLDLWRGAFAHLPKTSEGNGTAQQTKAGARQFLWVLVSSSVQWRWECLLWRDFLCSESLCQMAHARLACGGYTVSHLCWVHIFEGGSFVFINPEHLAASRHYSLETTFLQQTGYMSSDRLLKHFSTLVCDCAFILENLKWPRW